MFTNNIVTVQDQTRENMWSFFQTLITLSDCIYSTLETIFTFLSSLELHWAPAWPDW